MLRGRYRLERMLGRGGTSTVYLATDMRENRSVALKQISLADFPPDEAAAMARQLEREADLLGRLDHPSLVRVLDNFQAEGLHYLVLEYVEGCDLEHHLQTHLAAIGIDELLGWVDQVCDVLEYLHSQAPPVLFRDLKPANLMLDKAGRVRLIDFGIARLSSPDKQTTALLRGFGTPGYSPIEQYVGGTDVRSDIYSLGATIYALLCHRPPPDAAELASGMKRLPRLGQLNPKVPAPLERAVQKMLETRREDRYQTVAEARRALRASLLPQACSEPPAFCQYRDLNLRPLGLGLPHGHPVHNDPFTVIYQGHDPFAALEGARQSGLPTTKLWREDWPGLVPGCWMVLVSHGA